jgi:hypothetical protein
VSPRLKRIPPVCPVTCHKVCHMVCHAGTFGNGRVRQRSKPFKLGIGVRHGVSQGVEDAHRPPSGSRRVGHGGLRLNFRESMATPCHTPMKLGFLDRKNLCRKVERPEMKN